MALKYSEYELNETSIEEISSTLQEYLNGLGVESRNLQRIRLTVEEMLLNIMETLGRGVRIRVGLGEHLGRQLLRLRYRGAPCDPAASSESSWADDLMQTLGYYPAWSCKSGVNTVSLVLAERAKRSSLMNLLFAVLTSILLGLLGKLFPESLRQSLDEILLTPLSQAFLGLMGTFSGIMIAFTVCSGIFGIGDSVSLEKISKRFLRSFIFISFAICIAAELAVLPFLRLNRAAGAEGQGLPLGQISLMFFAILPSNPVEPFQTGNTMQIIVIALFIGIGLIVIGERGSRTRSLIDEGTALMQRIVSFICGFIPVFVFAMLLRLILFDKAGVLLSLWKPFVLLIGAELLVTAVFFLLAARRLQCPPPLLMQKILPPYLISLTTASSLAAMTLGMETCEKKLGIEKGTVNFAYPIGMVFFMPASVAGFTVFTCSFAEIFQVEVDLAWLMITVITVTLLVIAMPPIPGAGILVYSMIFANLGIPAEALVLVTALEVVADFINTSFNTMILILHTASEASKMGKLDQTALP